MKTDILENILKIYLDNEKGNEKIDNLATPFLGKYVIIRTRNEGVNCGYLIEADYTGCVLKEARRLWEHQSKDRDLSWYEGVSQSGLADGMRISGKVTKIILEDYSITLCTDIAKKSLENYETNKTTA